MESFTFVVIFGLYLTSMCPDSVKGFVSYDMVDPRQVKPQPQMPPEGDIYVPINLYGSGNEDNGSIIPNNILNDSDDDPKTQRTEQKMDVKRIGYQANSLILESLTYIYLKNLGCHFGGPFDHLLCLFRPLPVRGKVQFSPEGNVKKYYSTKSKY